MVRLTCENDAACHGKLTFTAKATVKVKGKATSRTVPIGTAQLCDSGRRGQDGEDQPETVGRGLLTSDHGASVPVWRSSGWNPLRNSRR
jgi:hypothetical protein